MPTEDTVVVDTDVTTATQAVPAREFLADADKHALDVIKLRMALAASNADLIKASYDNLVLQFTLKYNLKFQDAITEQGEIVRHKVQ